MASINLQSEDGGGDGYTSPERSQGVSSLLIKIACGQSGELSPPVVSVTSPVEQSSLSCSIMEQIANASTDWYPPETESSFDDSATVCQPEGSDGLGGNAIKKPVWSKLSIAVEKVSPVMDSVCWPALKESTEAAHKSSSSESLQTLSGESLLPELQVTGNSSSLSHELVSTPNHVTNSNPKNHTFKESPRRDFGSQPQPNGGNDHRYQRNLYRRGNGGVVLTRGGGSYHHNYGGKPNQGWGRGRGRGNQQWNQHRNFYRDTNMQPQRGGYVRPSVHNSTLFIHQPMLLPVQPFGNNALYPGGPAQPIVTGPFYYPVPEPLHVKIVKQIDYYFSNDNLVKDTYLRRHMDEQGWIAVNLIAGFNKVSSLTNNVQLILDVMQKSTVVEVQGEKMRRRNDWMRWLIPTAAQDSLGSQLHGIRLNDGSSSRSSSGELSSQLQQGGGDQAIMA